MSHPMVRQVGIRRDADLAKTYRQTRRRNFLRTTRHSAPEQEHKNPPRTLHPKQHTKPTTPCSPIGFPRRSILSGVIGFRAARSVLSAVADAARTEKYWRTEKKIATDREPAAQ